MTETSLLASALKSGVLTSDQVSAFLLCAAGSEFTVDSVAQAVGTVSERRQRRISALINVSGTEPGATIRAVVLQEGSKCVQMDLSWPEFMRCGGCADAWRGWINHPAPQLRHSAAIDAESVFFHVNQNGEKLKFQARDIDASEIAKICLDINRRESRLRPRCKAATLKHTTHLGPWYYDRIGEERRTYLAEVPSGRLLHPRYESLEPYVRSVQGRITEIGSFTANPTLLFAFISDEFSEDFPGNVSLATHLDLPQLTGNCILYLSDCEGGELLFDSEEYGDIMIRPRKGREIFFRAASVPHRVMKVTGGRRLFLCLGFTNEPSIDKRLLVALHYAPLTCAPTIEFERTLLEIFARFDKNIKYCWDSTDVKRFLQETNSELSSRMVDAVLEREQHESFLSSKSMCKLCFVNMMCELARINSAGTCADLTSLGYANYGQR